MAKYWSETIYCYDTTETIHAVCMKGSDGTVEIVAELLTRNDAREAAKQWNADYANAMHEEARHQAMYDHACGYYD